VSQSTFTDNDKDDLSSEEGLSGDGDGDQDGDDVGGIK
jgi:hypothetical protein